MAKKKTRDPMRRPALTKKLMRSFGAAQYAMFEMAFGDSEKLEKKADALTKKNRDEIARVYSYLSDLHTWAILHDKA